jgi:hypothetical protein
MSSKRRKYEKGRPQAAFFHWCSFLQFSNPIRREAADGFAWSHVMAG